jgi:PhoH-like ATPase
MAKVVVDTNYLIEQDDLEDLIKQYEIIIPICVLEEIDNLNHTSNDQNKKYKIRNAIRFIESNLDKITVDTNNYIRDKNDNKILDSCIENKAKLITFDVAMKIKAKAFDVGCIETDYKLQEQYKGYKVIQLSDEELAYWYENEFKVNSYDLLYNEYLLIQNKDDEIVDKLKWTEKGFVRLKMPSVKGLKPLNHLQQCAFDLMASDTPIKILLGHAGSGKTLINLRSALHYIEKGKFERILYVRNPIGKGESIGFLPGTKFEKMESYLAGVIDNLEMGDLQFKQLVAQEKIVVESPYFMKGASKVDTWFLVDEAEDLDVETLKLIGTRVAKGSVVCFTGDLHQTEKKYKSNNGLQKFINEFKGNPLVGIVKLNEDVRSDVSKLFNEL